jgi:hypothetical protein
LNTAHQPKESPWKAKPLNLGERMVTIARLLAAEHVRQELSHASSSERLVQQHVFSPVEIDQRAEQPASDKEAA